MARIVPGSGADIEPIFDEVFGVRAVKVLNGGSGYDPADPPRLTVTGCGTPEVEALLYPIIDEDSGRITHVRVLNRGRGYDPLRLQITPEDETPNVITSFDINRIWQSHPNSSTSAAFQISGSPAVQNDRLRIQSDNHPKPNQTILSERQPGGSDTIVDRSFDQTFIYRGGKDVPNPGTRDFQENKVTGIMANGVLLHTPDWGGDGNALTNFALNAPKYPYIKNANTYGAVTDSNTYYYQTNALTDEFSVANGVFDWGKIEEYVWEVKVEYGNILVNVSNVDESLGSVEVNRRIDEIGGNASANIAKIVRNNQNEITKVYLRNVQQTFTQNDLILGANGFTFTIDSDPISLNVYYINFGDDAAKFGPFLPGVFYFAPENIQVKRNYLIRFNQSDSSNSQGIGHPIQFSTTADGLLNGGSLYYDSTGVSGAASADYENEYQSLFIMNADESNRIYYHCKNHRYMSGYAGDEGYMILDTTPSNATLTNNYYTTDFFRGITEVTPSNFSNYNYTSRNITLLSSGDGTGDSGGFNVGEHFFFNGTGLRELTIDLDLTYSQQINVKIIRGNDSNGGEEVDNLFGEELRIQFVDSQYGSVVLGSATTPGLDSLTTVTVGVPADARIANSTVRIFQESPSGNTYDNWGVTSVIANIDLGGDNLARYPDGHSKILGMSFDGYPIYGPWGKSDAGVIRRETSSYRLKTTAELSGARPEVTTASTVTYAITVSNNQFLFDGSTVPFLTFERGKTYVFNQNDASNVDGLLIQTLLLSTTDDGWHGQLVGDTSYVYGASHSVTYHLDGSAVSYAAYISGFASASTREMRFLVPVDSPAVLYVFAYNQSNAGVRGVSEGYLLGDLVSDYIYDSSYGTLDEYNGRFAVTPEYPNGTYAYFMTEDSSGNPTYPYAIGPKMYGTPLFEGDTVPALTTSFPTDTAGDVVLNTNGTVSYIKMTRTGDNFFGNAKAKILGGEGTGATGNPVVQTVTGLSLLNSGRDYATPPTLIFEGGGGQGAQGAAEIDRLGKVTRIDVVDNGEFYQEPPYILITGGGGIGARAVARIDQGAVVGIDVVEEGTGYTSPPNVVFTKLVNLKRKTRARQSLNSSPIYLTGLVKDMTASDTDLFVDSTDAYPGSGSIILGTETITYTSKSEGKFSGLTRGVNFNYDQRIILDDGQNDSNGVSTYEYNVGDRVVRRVDNANNKVAKVYDWNPNTRELLVTFEVDELAFIDAGIPSTEDAIVQFDAGVPASANSNYQPHVIEVETGSTITLLTTPISTLQDRAFEDDDENEDPNNPGTFLGDGIADLVNTGTDYENQINLDGGIFSSLYGIEETQGGQNTTLFQVGDSIKDASVPFKYANVATAGGLSDGVEHTAIVQIYIDSNSGNGQNFSTNEVVTGQVSGVRGTVVTWDPNTGLLVVQDIIPFNTNNINVGIAGYLYEFSSKGTIIDFNIQNQGTNYTATPTVAIENTGDIQATATVNMTTAGDQVESLTITNGGYGIPQTVDGTYNIHPTVTFTNAGSDSTGAGAVAQAILGGEVITGNGGASYRIKRIEYSTIIRSK